MQLFSALLFGISASLDALLMGVTYGLRSIRIGLRQNILISMITLFGTCLSVGFGSLLGPLLPSSLGKWAGSAILILYGLYYLMKSMKNMQKKYRKNVADSTEIHCAQRREASKLSPSLSYGSALTLGVALSVNNIGIGLSASIAGLSLLPAAAMTILFSVSFLFLGNHLGRSCLSRWIGDAADPISGVLLIILGVWEWFS